MDYILPLLVLTVLPHSAVISANAVHGSIPPCVLQMPSMATLHLGGNGIRGAIPNVPLSASLNELVLASNDLTGSIPSFIWYSNVTSLDISLNRLEGTLPSDLLPAAQ
jgi:hypothetical protein